MKNNPTQNNTPAENAKPAKKQWQKPDFYLLDTADINSGAIGTGVEGAKTLHNGTPGTNPAGTNVTKFYHS